MAYSTEDQVKIRLKDFVNQQVPTEVIQLAIQMADGMIDSRLNQYWNISQFSASIGIINMLSINLACVFTTGTLFNDFDQSSSTWESKLYSFCNRELRDLQDGISGVPGVDRVGL